MCLFSFKHSSIFPDFKPKTLQSGSKTLHFGLKTLQSGLKTLHFGPKTLQRELKTLHFGSKTLQSSPFCNVFGLFIGNFWQMRNCWERGFKVNGLDGIEKARRALPFASGFFKMAEIAFASGQN